MDFKAADIYGFAVLLWTMYTRQTPFGDLTRVPGADLAQVHSHQPKFFPYSSSCCAFWGPHFFIFAHAQMVMLIDHLEQAASRDPVGVPGLPGCPHQRLLEPQPICPTRCCPGGYALLPLSPARPAYFATDSTQVTARLASIAGALNGGGDLDVPLRIQSTTWSATRARANTALALGGQQKVAGAVVLVGKLLVVSCTLHVCVIYFRALCLHRSTRRLQR